MPLVKVSRTYHVVIPKSVREALKIRPGQELHMYVLDGRIRLSKPGSIKDLRGVAKGMRWKDDYRDHTERF
jgi:AbrB family looped-hinge helix DNA binding protein